jgi:hypothetical protein
MTGVEILVASFIRAFLFEFTEHTMNAASHPLLSSQPVYDTTCMLIMQRFNAEE